jgi:hypothetical protein
MAATTSVLTRDPELRELLVRRLDHQYGDDPDTFLCHEFTICRSRARIDVAVINGSLTGFEIKSAADRLDRLPRQCREYERVFDTITVVSAPGHLLGVIDLVPDWYGIWMADPGAERSLEPVRQAHANPQPSTRARLALLWRSEMLSVAAEHCVPTARRATRRMLVDQLMETVPPAALHGAVKDRLKTRLRAERLLDAS